MTLKDCMPIEFMSCEFEDDRARKFADIEVISEHHNFSKKWIGKQKNVGFWVELSNGYAVGMNENPARGLSFPVIKMERIMSIDLGNYYTKVPNDNIFIKSK
jgi:hypothetical protein